METPTAKVVALSTTPIKGLRLVEHPELKLERGGVCGDRRLYLIDQRGYVVKGKRLGALSEVIADIDAEQLRLTFPDGRVVSGEIERGEPLETTFFSKQLLARIVHGPFAAALSRHTGMPLRLVEPADGTSAVDRGEGGVVTMISQGSLAALARAAGNSTIDARRFRMSIEIDAHEPFAEESWVGREIALGEARIELRGHVGRCIVTSRHPETGEVNLPTLDLLRELRAGASSTEPLPFGVHGAVLQEGVVRVGDGVEVR